MRLTPHSPQVALYVFSVYHTDIGRMLEGFMACCEESCDERMGELAVEFGNGFDQYETLLDSQECFVALESLLQGSCVVSFRDLSDACGVCIEV